MTRTPHSQLPQARRTALPARRSALSPALRAALTSPRSALSHALRAALAAGTVAASLAAGPAGAQDAAPHRAPPGAASAPAREVRLSLAEALALALQNHPDLEVAAFEPRRAAAEVGRQQGVFDPTFSVFAGAERDRTPTGSPALGSDQKGLAGEAHLSGRLPWGTEYDLSYGTRRLETDAQLAPSSPSHAAQALLRVKQPLLRGRGSDVGRAAITLAHGSRRIAEATFRRTAEQTLALTVDAYWRLVRARQSLEVARESLRLARELGERARRRVEAGDLPPVEHTQARASVAAREEAVILAEAEVGNANDALARALLVEPGDDEPGDAFAVTLVPTDAPGFSPADVQLEPALQTALRQRPELEAARRAVQNGEVSERFARNQRLVDLSAVGSVGVGGLDARWPGAQAQLASALDSQYRWSAGLQLSVPLGNRSARNAHAQARLSLGEAQAALRRLQLQVAEEVRVAVRSLEADAKRVEATRRAAELAREQLAAEEQRLGTGLSTAFEVLRLQADLAAAQNAEIAAATDYRSSTLRVDLATGTLLQRFGLALRE